MDEGTRQLLDRAVVGVEPERGLDDVKARARQRRIRERVAAGMTALIVAVAGVGGAIVVWNDSADRSVPVSPAPQVPMPGNGRLAFVRVERASVSREGSPSAGLYTIGPTGARPTRIATDVAYESGASWSPDGSRVAYVNDGLWIASPDGTNAFELYACEGVGCSGIGSPAWSPDGSRLAFWSATSKRNEGIWVIDKNGANLRLLTAGLSTGQPTWSPDGSELAVSGTRTGGPSKPAIFVLNAASGRIVRTIRPDGLQLGFDISWSPDGNRLAFDALGRGGNQRDAGIYFSDPAGANIARAVSWGCPSGLCTARTPDWSPDGKLLAFTATTNSLGSDGSVGEIRVLDLHTGAIQVLTKGKLDCCPAWQPIPQTPSIEPGASIPTSRPTGFPPVTVTPTHGPIGTRLRIEGVGFGGREWQDAEGGYGVFLDSLINSGCELIAGDHATIDIDKDGHLVAEVTVPAKGSCFQSSRTEPVRPGTYGIGIVCHACVVGTFVVDPPT